jgi:hypothetical protein
METVTINGEKIKMTKYQAEELKRDGMVIVGDRIIRTGEYALPDRGLISPHLQEGLCVEIERPGTDVEFAYGTTAYPEASIVDGY